VEDVGGVDGGEEYLGGGGVLGDDHLGVGGAVCERRRASHNSAAIG